MRHDRERSCSVSYRIATCAGCNDDNKRKSDGGDTPVVRVTRDGQEEILRVLVKVMRVFVN